MNAVAPPDIVTAAVDSGEEKTGLPAWQLVLRAFLATFLLGAATTLAVMAEEQTGVAVLGALLFPIGLTLVVLLGLELVTGAFGVVPLAVAERRATVGQCLRVFGWLIAGHVVGGATSAWMITSVLTGMGTSPEEPTAQALADLAVTKTLDYQEAGVASGLAWVTLSAVLCNWLVVLGVVMALASTSTTGKIAGMWLPILAFYALGYEHAVVNFFVLPAGMMAGAPITLGDWWLWNQLPALLGNFVGGATLAGFGLYLSHRSRVGRPGEDEAQAD